MEKKIELFKVAALDFNKNLEMINKFIKYFDELDNYKYGLDHNLKEQEIEKIEEIGFNKYCEILINKMTQYENNFNTISFYIEYDLGIKISDQQIKKGIDLKGYVKLVNSDMVIKI